MQVDGVFSVSDSQDKDDQQAAPTTARLLRLADFDRTRPANILADMQAYWHSLRQGRAIPARSDIEPRAIHRALDYAFILERIAPGAARFRLAGRHLIDLMGMEVRGMPICAFLNPRSRGRLSDVLESVFKAPQIARMTLHAPAEYARPQLEGQMLLLPLRSDLGDVTRALGCLIAEGNTGVAPRRFDLMTDEVIPIIQGGATLAPSPSSQGFADKGAPFDRTERILTKGRRRREAAAPTPAAEGGRDKVATGPAIEASPRPASPPPDLQPPDLQPPDLQPQTPPGGDTPEHRRAMFRVISTGS